MNNLDVSGILRTYSEKAAHIQDTKRLRKLIRDLKKELDLRKVNMENER